MPWNVPAQVRASLIVPAFAPITCLHIRSTRRAISAAARRENVISRMRCGSAPLTMRWATRWASVFVLPDPAPAMTSSGAADSHLPSRTPCSTARRCSGLSFSRYAVDIGYQPRSPGVSPPSYAADLISRRLLFDRQRCLGSHPNTRTKIELRMKTKRSTAKPTIDFAPIFFKNLAHSPRYMRRLPLADPGTRIGALVTPVAFNRPCRARGTHLRKSRSSDA